MNYYNEHDPKAAAWLRELIRAGEIPPGDVDTRDIQEIRPHELSGYTQQHFFAGIGGWSLALRIAGWPPDRPVRTGSCPCQPFSSAGLGRGYEDPRHLWPHFRDLITFGEPTVTFGEQVASAAGRQWLDRVRADLEGLGYAVGAADLCAAGVGAPNIRQRLFWVADATDQRYAKRNEPACASSRRSRSRAEALRRGEPCGLADGDGERLTGRPESNQREEQSELDASRRADALRCSHAGGVGDANGHGRRQDGCHVSGCDEANRVRQANRARDAGASFWRNFDLLHCANGKSRRVEPGTFPLAHGVSGRVGLLRGYGNAINPQITAEFVSAYLET